MAGLIVLAFRKLAWSWAGECWTNRSCRFKWVIEAQIFNCGWEFKIGGRVRGVKIYKLIIFSRIKFSIKLLIFLIQRPELWTFMCWQPTPDWINNHVSFGTTDCLKWSSLVKSGLIENGWTREIFLDKISGTSADVTSFTRIDLGCWHCWLYFPTW